MFVGCVSGVCLPDVLVECVCRVCATWSVFVGCVSGVCLPGVLRGVCWYHDIYHTHFLMGYEQTPKSDMAHLLLVQLLFCYCCSLSRCASAVTCYNMLCNMQHGCP